VSARPDAETLPWRVYRAVRPVVGRLTAPVRRVELHVNLRRELAAPIPDYRARAPIHVREATPEDIREVAAIRLPHLDVRDRYEQRLGRGQRCFVARVDDEIVGSNWLNTGQQVDEGRLVRLADDEVYSFDVFTAPAWRGRGIHGHLLHDMLDTARDEGYRVANTTAQVLRRRSMKGADHFDWERAGYFLTIAPPGGRAPWIVRLTGTLYPVAGAVPLWDDALG
jgi:GNAT superfamily N-acetyltransferase